MQKGKPVSRHFTIGPGSSAEVLFTAVQSEAEKSATGAYIPKQGSAKTIRVSAKYHDLALMAYKWGFLEQDYMTKRYCMANMQSRYNPDSQSSGADAVNAAPEQPVASVQEEPFTADDGEGVELFK